MRNLDLENKVYAACTCPLSRRNFTEEEIVYTLQNESFRDTLLCWFESSESDGCWTEETVCLMRSFYPLKARPQEGKEQLLDDWDDVVF
ncbi:hypothetical protein [Scytonema sp. NUACC26]|uniref:hypothetical protein n=1 Tax=Scytonema sp. NUACC26 TaxID=3140176 RepID=UPI0034DC2CF4